VRLPRAGETDPSVPDVPVVCDAAKLDERDVPGAPDWVAEVLSPASAGRDETVNLAADERAGVPEVSLRHPTDRVFILYRLEGGRDGRPLTQAIRGGVAIAVLLEVIVDFDLFTE
jgi:Uma2 family endonuclease